jgi:hypothetical protein
MKIKITFPIHKHSLWAGLVYDVPAKLARELIKEDKAFEVKEEKVKDDNRQNNP